MRYRFRSLDSLCPVDQILWTTPLVSSLSAVLELIRSPVAVIIGFRSSIYGSTSAESIRHQRYVLDLPSNMVWKEGAAFGATLPHVHQRLCMLPPPSFHSPFTRCSSCIKNSRDGEAGMKAMPVQECPQDEGATSGATSASFVI